MSMKKGLGRGFDSLIPTELIDESLDPTAAQDERVSDLRQISLTKIVTNPDQPRRHFDEAALEDLSQSIAEHGLVQPIVVVPKGDKFEIVAGERRFRAANKAGLDQIPALVRTLNDQNKLEVSLIENLQRRDLNILETATAYLKLRDQFNLSLEEIGKRVGGRSTSSVSNILRILRLPDSVKKALRDGKLSEGQARPLINIDKKIVEAILPRILKEEWSARAIEQYVVNLKTDSKNSKALTTKIATDSEIIGRWRHRLGTESVVIHTNSRGAGQIVIKFKNQDELKKIENHLG